MSNAQLAFPEKALIRPSHPAPRSNMDGPPVEPSGFTLRAYQQRAISSSLLAISEDHHPVISLPTGSGKSLIIAALAQHIPGRILVVTHRQELIAQNAQVLRRWDGATEAGIYSAGLGVRETVQRVLFAGVQSIYRRMSELQAAGSFAAVIVDECHLVPPPSRDSMYGDILGSVNGAARIGLSATPYRLTDGPVWEGPDSWFNTLAIDIGILQLTPEYLAPLHGILTAHDIDTSGVRVQQGEFVLSDMSQIACAEGCTEAALDELVQLGTRRRKWLVFCIDVAHTEHVAALLKQRGITSRVLVGATDSDERREIVAGFKAGVFRALVNCQVATTGFDVPDIDLIALLRPSQSKALIVQMLGRGSRQAEGKLDCLVVDFGGNIERHAPLDVFPDPPQKSPQRELEDAEKKRLKAAARARRHDHERKASLADPFGEQTLAHHCEVVSIHFELQVAKKYPGKTNLVVKYLLRDAPWKWAMQWVCLEYPGRAAWHAQQWFRRRGAEMPKSAADAYTHREIYPRPGSVLVRQVGRYPQITAEFFDCAEKPGEENW